MNVARKSTRTVLIIAWLMFPAITPVRSEDSSNELKAATEAARQEAKQRRARFPLAKGALKEVDLLRHQLKLTTEDGVQTFTYTSRTYIFRDKDKITVDKLKLGEIVALRFETDKDGNNTATRIKVQGSPPSTDASPPGTSALTNQLPHSLP